LVELPPDTRIADQFPASNFQEPAMNRSEAKPSSLSSSVQAASGYAGDVSAQQAFDWMQAGSAVLVDVRTDAEREWVGFVPGAVPLAWKQWPGMAENPGFDAGLKSLVPPDKKVVLLCRSGVRSIAAARRATELGLEAYNILEGFEGDADQQAQRGHRGGWRFRGLPWRQS
jgi:sulfur dioxygenase